MGEQMHDAIFRLKLWIAWYPIKFLPGHRRLRKSAFIRLDRNDISAFNIWWHSLWIRRSAGAFQPFSSYRTDKLRSLKTKTKNIARIMVYQHFQAILSADKSESLAENPNVKVISTKAQRTIKHQLQNVLRVYHEWIFQEFRQNGGGFRAHRDRQRIDANIKRRFREDFVLHCVKCLLHQLLNQKRLPFQLNTFQKRSIPLIFQSMVWMFRITITTFSIALKRIKMYEQRGPSYKNVNRLSKSLQSSRGCDWIDLYL